MFIWSCDHKAGEASRKPGRSKCGLKASRSAKPAPHEPNPGDLDYLGWILIQIILSL